MAERGDSLLGRDETRARLRGVVEAAGSGDAALVVVGEPSIGKSALLDDAARVARNQGALVLRTSGVPSESRLPFAGLDQLVGPVLGDAVDLPAPLHAALDGALGRREVTGDHVAVSLAVLELLRLRAADRPVVLIVDDLHWLDRCTLDLLAFVARRVTGDEVALLASSRQRPTGSLAELGLPEVVLEGVDERSASTLVDRHGADLAPALRDRLLREAEGNPLALVELAIGWSRLPPAVLLDSWVPLTARVEDVFAARAEPLPPICRTLLLLAALDDGDGLADLLAAAELVVGVPVGQEVLRPAIAARLVSLDARGVSFRHPLVRSAIYQSADDIDRRAAHRALATVLTDDDRVAWHRAAAAHDPDEDIAAALDRAAARARRHGAVLSAISALERAADLSPEPPARGRRLVRAAELAEELGRRDVVERLLDAAEALALDPLDDARVAWRRRFMDGALPQDLVEVRVLVDIADSMRAAGDVDLAIESLMEVAGAGWWADADPEHLRLVAAAARGLDLPDTDPRLLLVLAKASPVEDGAAVLDRVRGVDPASLADPAVGVLLGATAGMLGAHHLAIGYLDRANRRLRAEGRLGLLSDGLVSRAWAAWHIGDWDGAVLAAGEARRLGERNARQYAVGSSQLLEGLIAAVRGDPAAGEAAATEVERRFRPLGTRTMVSLAGVVRSVALLTNGHAAAAHELMPLRFDRPIEGPAAALGLGTIGLAVDAAVHSGRADAVRPLIDRLTQLECRTGSPAVRVALAYARPLLATDDEAEGLYLAALASDLERWPFEHARLVLAYGTWLRRRRRTTEARLALRAARDAFDVLRATPWGDRARRELRASGEVSRRRPAGAVDHLTAQELEIARLAADGLTNREIGQRLLLSHRTVGSHLYHLFPKLGVASRSELGAALADTALADVVLADTPVAGVGDSVDHG